MEHKTELKTFLVNYKCPSCESGFMHSVKGVTLTTTPVKYVNKCQNQECGHEMLLPKEYPFTQHEVIASKAKPIQKKSQLKKK